LDSKYKCYSRWGDVGEIADLDKGEVRCSIGVSCNFPMDPCNGEELLKQAKKMLYRAKNSGRD